MKSKTVAVYGIKNCETMKKARAWLEQHGVDYVFHDYKVEDVEKARLEGWVKQAGWETVLNRAGMTFRNLPESAKANLTEKKAVALMLANPSMIKRPVVEAGAKLLIGFKPDAYEKAFG
ncbi:MAG TPA: ArsC family reductase [Caulobacterales bacterium]|nr:ArsC family reductase [Caulobacterales bacterium]